MMRVAFALAALAFALDAQPVLALTAEDMEGSYEDAGRNNTCAENPARLTVRRGPDHVVFTWPEPTAIYDGTVTTGVAYDLVEEREDVLVLRLEGETRRTDDGALVIWLLRPTQDGFCWGRTDWPVIRCVNPFRRCADPAPIS